MRYTASSVALLFLPLIGYAQVARVTVSDTAGAPVPGLEVRLMSFDSMKVVATEAPAAGSRGPLVLAGRPPRARFVKYIIVACAEGWQPQIITAPFARGDTLELSMRMARATIRGPMPIGPGACAWQSDSVRRIRITQARNFASRAALTIAEVDSLNDNVPRDSSARSVYVQSVRAGLDRALRDAPSADERARAAFIRVAFQTATGTLLPSDMRARLQAALPPTSRWWACAYPRVQLMTFLLFDTPGGKDSSAQAVLRRKRALSYLERLEASVGEPEIQSEARYELVRLMFGSGDPARAQTILQRILDEEPEYPFSRIAISRFSQTTALRKGVAMPAFDFAALPDVTAPRITNSAIHSRLTLINFWGTWCGPCRRELPALGHVYAKYHAHGLDIISVAADESADVVNQFQRTNRLIKWTSAYGGPTTAPAFRRLGVVVFPRTVLVNAEGIIVASTGGVSETELNTLIERALAR